MNELYRIYRPKKLSQVIGQESAVKMLLGFLKKGKVPHVLLFTGPSGCGKTTLARIMRRKLKCSTQDFNEVDCADFRGIDMVREIKQTLGLAPMGGTCKVWYIDECHKLTSDGQAALLKVLEDTPDHIYFFLATTDPEKLLPTVKTRCTEIKVQALSEKDLDEMIRRVLVMENKSDLPDAVVDELSVKAEGSARKALVLLNQVIGMESEEEMMEVLAKADTKTTAIQIARELISPKPQWPKVAGILKNMQDEPETVRRVMLGYASSVLLGGGRLAPRALLLIDLFADNFYDSGKAGLVAACYAVSNDKTR